MLPFILLPFSFTQPSSSHICAFISPQIIMLKPSSVAIYTTSLMYSNFKMFYYVCTPSQFIYTLPSNQSTLLSRFPILTKHTSSILPVISSHLIPSLMVIPPPPYLPFVHSIFAACRVHPLFTSRYSSPVRSVSFMALTSQLLLLIQSIISEFLTLLDTTIRLLFSVTILPFTYGAPHSTFYLLSGSVLLLFLPLSLSLHLSYSLLNSTLNGHMFGSSSLCRSHTTSTTSLQLCLAPIVSNTSFSQSTSDFPFFFFRLNIMILLFLVSFSVVHFSSFLISHFFTIIPDSTISSLLIT